MVNYIRATHPKNNFGLNYKVSEIVFDMKSGAHMCLITSKYSAFDDFGVSMSLYFRFLKYLALCFAILGVISTPTLFFNNQGYLFILRLAVKLNPNVNPKQSFQDVLFSTTIGGFAYGILIYLKKKMLFVGLFGIISRNLLKMI